MKKYTPIYSDNLTDIYNYLAQFMCKRRADKEKVKLPKYFWRKEHRETFFKWQKIYQVEMMKARSLVNNSGFSGEAIINALNTRDGKFALSLHNKKLPDIIIEEQRKIDKQKSITTNITMSNEFSIPKRKNKNTKNKLNKLR